MHKIEKLLRQLSLKERHAVLGAISRILTGDTANFDIKKLKGHKNIYRIRIGTIRIIYAKEASVRIVAIERRNDTTYQV